MGEYEKLGLRYNLNPYQSLVEHRHVRVSNYWPDRPSLELPFKFPESRLRQRKEVLKVAASLGSCQLWQLVELHW